MTAPIVFLDTETFGLDVADPVWEVAAVRRDPDGTETEYHAFVMHDPAAAQALPESFRTDHDTRYRFDVAVPPWVLVDDLLELFAPPADYRQRAHVAGMVPSFDTERIGLLFRRYAREEGPWHHHLIDVETLAVGRLQGQDASGWMPPVHPPWDSENVSRSVGVDPARFERHTAMGDVRWAMAIYDAVMGL
jgi:hypothetical protein